jgi:hypothetical protein
MVPRIATRILAGSYGLVDDLGKILPFGVAKERLQITRAPELGARFGKLDFLTVRKMMEPYVFPLRRGVRHAGLARVVPIWTFPNIRK